MFFNTFDFFLFFIIFFLVYWSLGHRLRNILLLVGSYIFYAFFSIYFLFLILVTTIVGFFCGINIHNAIDKNKKNIFLWINVGVSLLTLFIFKYYGFFVDNFASLLKLIGINNISFLHLELVVPIGISYYLLKNISYTIDIYRKIINPCEVKLLHYAVYISFFPQILAGPIERASNFLTQVPKPKSFDKNLFSKGCYLIFWGLFKKVFIADNLAPIVNDIFYQSTDKSGFVVLIGLYAFIIKMYADFSGYTDIARGISDCLGYKTMLNFNLPFFAKNPVEIWRRWHISLSSWCRDYIFYYLNRLKMKIIGDVAYGTIIVMIFTMAIMGLWHGASWNFVLWGIYHGIILAIYHIVLNILGKKSLIKSNSKILPVFNICKMFFIFNLFAVGAGFFLDMNFDQSKKLICSLFFNFSITRYSLFMLGQLVFYIWPLVVLEIVQYKSNNQLIILSWNPWIKGFVYFVLLLLLLSFGVTGGEEFFYAKF